VEVFDSTRPGANWSNIIGGFLAVFVVSLLGSCNAQVKTFSAVPRHICAGEPVQVQWDVVGSASITVTPPNAALPNGPVESNGQATITPENTTTVALQVTHVLGTPTTSSKEIEVRDPASTPEVLAASLGDPDAQPGCDGGKAWATIHVKRFAADVKVATVATHPGDNRVYEIQHAGVHASAAPGGQTIAFSGTPIMGDWLVSTPLTAGQTCRTIPHNLVVDVITQCVPERDR
jgi:hypothetical protein